jgi:TDG/mug DNA glycosylase family protein
MTPGNLPPRLPRPTPEQLQAAPRRRLPDHIRPGLRILFCGINPGLYSAALGFHFARPGNRFWPALHLAGLTPRLLRPDEARLLLKDGLGLTDIVPRPTAKAGELTTQELIQGMRALERKVRRVRPRWVAFLGITAYRRATGLARAEVGPQPGGIGPARVWVLPNPSGLNAHHQLEDLARALRALATVAGSVGGYPR